MFAAVSLALVALFIAATVCLRTAGHNLPDALELSSLFMAVAVFWGMVGAVQRDEFIKVDFVLMFLGRRGATVLRYISGGITAGFLVLMAYAGFDQLILTLKSGEVTPELRFPLWPILGLGLSGLFVTALVGVALIWPSRSRRANPKQR